jgi:GMP synthase-like glutamine amidotransferase
MSITNCFGLYPTIREVEFYNDSQANIAFDNWIVAVDVTNEPDGPYGNTQWFIDRARQCSGWENVLGQQLWVWGCNEDFLNIEPYPLCVFLSGSFDEWCQVNREYFAGIGDIITNANIPIWASCGGAQLMGLLEEPGWWNLWDCPRCRQRNHHNPPYSPIYGYIGYLNPAIEPGLCGSYENNIYEIGDYLILKVGSDPVFNGLENQFCAYEYHCGQLNYLPVGWHQIGGAGSGTLTNMQCFRKDNTLIYGAQFHIKNESGYYVTNNNSRINMTNLLNLAMQSGGYHSPQ